MSPAPVRPLWALLLLTAASPWAAHAQTVTSEAPESVAVTVYRAQGRRADTPIDPRWLQGYALVTEKRRVRIPAGRATIRFEGVAGRILPESAILTGLPDGVREKNLDADLLSRRSLYDRSLGRPVTIRRTLDGKTVEERAIIRSGPEGAAVIETSDGFTAVNCGPQDETIIYDGVPAGLSAKPTLSVETEAAEAREASLTLSYLAWGFDWQANYVATMRPDGKSADLFAWITLANGDVTSFADAETMVVAGKIRSGAGPAAIESETELSLRCYALPVPEPLPPPSPPYPPSPPVMMAPTAAAPKAEAIVVTAARMARQEELGDLKLYRVPDATTVAAMSQKQVALLDRKSVRVEVVYRSRVYNEDLSGAPQLLLRAQNRTAEGLGLPLPAGSVAVFEPRGAERLLVGEGFTEDKAINEEVEIAFARSPQVQADIEEVAEGVGWEEFLLTVTNANPRPIRYEAELELEQERYRRTNVSARLARKNGRDIWGVTVPANGTRTLRFRLNAVR